MKSTYYRVWAFHYRDGVLIEDDGFEFYLHESGLLTGVKAMAEAAMLALVPAYSGLVVFDHETDEPILGIVRDPADGDLLFGLEIENDDEDLFYAVAERWFQSSFEERKQLYLAATGVHGISQ